MKSARELFMTQSSGAQPQGPIYLRTSAEIQAHLERRRAQPPWRVLEIMDDGTVRYDPPKAPKDEGRREPCPN